MVPSNSVVTINVAGQVKGIYTADDVATAVSTDLAQSPLTVLALTVTPDHYALTNVLLGEWLHYTYTAAMTVRTGQDYDSTDAIAAVVREAFGSVIGTPPESANATTNTTEPAVVVPGQPSPTNPGDAIGDFFHALETDMKWILIVVAVLILAAIVVIGWGPNVPSAVPRA